MGDAQRMSLPRICAVAGAKDAPRSRSPRLEPRMLRGWLHEASRVAEGTGHPWIEVVGGAARS